MRLIDADALYQSFGASGNCNNCPLDAYKCQYYNEHTLMEFCERIDDAPTVDAKPVRHGHWIETHEVLDYIRCSECGEDWCTEDNDTETFNYCPNCGAKMDVETGNTYSIGEIELPIGVFRQIYDEERKEDETD